MFGLGKGHTRSIQPSIDAPQPPLGRAILAGDHEAALAAIPRGILRQACARQRVGQVEAGGLLDTELLAQEHPLPIRKDALDVERGPGLVAPRVAVARVRRRGREADLPRRVVWAAPLV